ncbi:MAG TPA: glycosyltransferase family 4 protein [Ilumatobacteraceae bacterium]
MRVLTVTWEYPPGTAGGIAAHVAGLARAMAAAGHEVVVITRACPGVERDATMWGVRVLRADVDMPWIPEHDVVARTASGNHALVAAAAALDGWRPDVVHTHDWNVAWAGTVLAKLHGVPLVTTLHGTERGRHGGHLPPGEATDINSVEWWLAFGSQRVITSTKLMVREILGGFELDPERVRRIPNGIDPSWWQQRDEDPDDAPVNSRTVFTWGRVQYEKGFQVLVRAISTLRNRVPGISCTIAGRGSYLPELQSQVDLEGVSDLVNLPGYVADEDLRTAIHRAGCVVIPSLYEPFGIVALEALAGGASLVVADTGGLAELVGGTGSALLFEPGNAEELADQIERLLTEPELVTSLRQRGTQILDATYSWDAIAARTVDVYREVATPAP